MRTPRLRILGTTTAPPATGWLPWFQNSNQIAEGNMLKDVTGQNITALLLDTEGAIVTDGTTTVYVTGDAGTPTTMGTATYEAYGVWSIDVTQSESNYDNIGFTWVNTGAVTVHQQVFTDQAYDAVATAQADLDIITGATGVILDTDAVTAAKIADDAFSNEHFTDGALTSIEVTSVGAVDNLGAGASGAVNIEATEDNASGAIIDSVTKVGTPTGTFANCDVEDGVILSIAHDGDDIDWVFGFDVGGYRQGTEASIVANVNANTDDMLIKAYDHIGDTWDTIATLEGSGGAAYKSLTASLLSKHTGTGSELGKVYIRFDTADTPSVLQVDKITVAAVSTSLSVGYSNGAVWIDTVNGLDSAVSYVAGMADVPCKTWTNSKTLLSALGLSRIQVVNGSDITLDESSANLHLEGEGWMLALGNQNITSTYFKGAVVSGIGTGAQPVFEACEITNSTSTAAAKFVDCGFSCASGTPYTAIAGTGEYLFTKCFSQVAGSGTPYFDFSPASGTMGINNRGWFGGANYTLNTNCTLSHEVVGGGGTTVTPADAAVEIRGLCRAITLALSDTDVGNQIQVIANTGPVTITSSGSGDSATINLYGTTSGISDGSSGGTTVTDSMVSNVSINTQADTALSDYDGPTNTEMDSAFTEIKGATWASGTDTLEHIRNKQTDIEADTSELQTDWANGGRLDLILDATLAMLDDTRTEPGQGAPAVNPDSMTKLDYLYKAWRNKTLQSSTEYKLYDDAGTTIDQKATVSDDGTDFTKGEVSTGA